MIEKAMVMPNPLQVVPNSQGGYQDRIKKGKGGSNKKIEWRLY